MTCPDCGQPWGDGPKCQSCQLDIEDLAAAAQSFDRTQKPLSPP